MNKRIVSALLWFYAGWTLGALMATALDLSAWLGPVIGAAAAALFAGDPRRIIWASGEAGPDPEEARRIIG